MNKFSYCRNEVKQHDYYRYLCCFFAPSSLRKKLFAIYAFNIEISRIKNITSENREGIAWWLEAIRQIYAKRELKDHKVIIALAEIIQETHIPSQYFEHMIVAHEADIGIKQITDAEHFQKYIDATTTNLLKASLHIMGVASKEAFEAAHHIGMAYALTQQMLSMKQDSHKRHILLPRDMLEKNSIHIYDMATDRHLEALKPIVQELCSKVEFHLKKADMLKKSLPKEALPIYVHSIIASIFVRHIRTNDYDLFKKNLEPSRLDVFIKIFLAAKLGIKPAYIERPANIVSSYNWKYIVILFSVILFIGKTVNQADIREQEAHETSLRIYHACENSKDSIKRTNCADKSGKRYTEKFSAEESDIAILQQSFIYVIMAWIYIIIPLWILKWIIARFISLRSPEE